MKLKVKEINFETGNTNVIVVNYKTAEVLGKRAGDRVILKAINLDKFKPLIAILDITYSDSIVAPGEIGIFLDIYKNLEGAELISVKPAEVPDSFKFIKSKIKGNKLTAIEINRIIEDAVSGSLSQIELASFITAASIKGMDNEEMTALTIAEAKSGSLFNFGPNVFDKHSTYISI